MNEYHLTICNSHEVFTDIRARLEKNGDQIIEVKSARIGKWGMAKLWRAWMAETAKFMASNGVKMPLMIDAKGDNFGTRPFGPEDAHELFTSQWLGVDAEGLRLSWGRKGRDGMRPANKGERFSAMLRHEAWAIERGINLFKPKDSELESIRKETEG